MRSKLVAGNWKMHGSRAENAPLVEAILAVSGIESIECVLCPPHVYLADVGRMLRDSSVRLGAQNLSAESAGAFTGEVSAAMLRDVGCQYVIVGHSERRHLYGEDDMLVARKCAAALARGLTPILCLGEQLSEREAGRTHEVIERQLEAVVGLTGIEGFGRAVIAYEPVWAIGTGRTASPPQVEDVHAFIRQRLARRDAKIAAGLQILYGGSVKAGNAGELFAQADVDGGLIGGASLKADEFSSIIAAARG
jgi:triosephosphate isomerase